MARTATIPFVHEPAMLDLLAPRGQSRSIGAEQGRSVRNGVSRWDNPNGSVRYVLSRDGVPLSVLQLVRTPQGSAVVCNVFTRAEARRQSLATFLYARAKNDFPDITLSDDLTADGANWSNHVEPLPGIAPMSDTLIVDGVQRPRQNSEGQAIHATESGIANFWRWFGDSRATDNLGRPLVLYHGTTREFDQFDVARRGEKTQAADAHAGFFFAENPCAAEQFIWENGEKCGHIMPVYVRIHAQAESDHLLTGATGTQAGRILREHRVNGMDGVVFLQSNMLGHEGRTFVVFDAANIKSSVGNSGLFNANSPSLTDVAAPAPTLRMIWVDGQCRPSDNSAGRPIHATEQGIVNFWRWFGNSQAVDTYGRPLVLYHGTVHDIESFNGRGEIYGAEAGAIYFSHSADVAGQYADAHGAKGQVIYPVYLRIEDAILVDGRQEHPTVTRQGLAIQTLNGGSRYARDWDVVQQAALPHRKQAGKHGQPADGMVLLSIRDSARYGEGAPINVYVAFDPCQIKSAVGNSGEFAAGSAKLSDVQLEVNTFCIADDMVFG